MWALHVPEFPSAPWGVHLSVNKFGHAKSYGTRTEGICGENPLTRSSQKGKFRWTEKAWAVGGTGSVWGSGRLCAEGVLCRGSLRGRGGCCLTQSQSGGPGAEALHNASPGCGRG
ncbi:hypothetical protein AA0473_1644 [Acetobacter orleanensis NRIC 0473]|uniref:Uncharacterized protein n=1 Tax=Acetobacter orleanensis TaxID=104099 RepID=A0A4Y3TKG6_9PROT|nr:hypothetical protein Abol_021_137 [Acetobacter orleanensis JCM 7639]GBR28115.1 hypothetical protein AA0473_1644 [Acetobacter orleanensis NRIC 0473]GEB82244.1 hypothetical protein AOR01nite_07210 [Acetobacter orleanensis]